MKKRARSSSSCAAAAASSGVRSVKDDATPFSLGFKLYQPHYDRDGTFRSQPRLRSQHYSSCGPQQPSSLQLALTRLFNLMQTSPSKCQTDVSYLVQDQEFRAHSMVILAWSRPLHAKASLWKADPRRKKSDPPVTWPRGHVSCT